MTIKPFKTDEILNVFSGTMAENAASHAEIGDLQMKIVTFKTKTAAFNAKAYAFDVKIDVFSVVGADFDVKCVMFCFKNGDFNVVATYFCMKFGDFCFKFSNYSANDAA